MDTEDKAVKPWEPDPVWDTLNGCLNTALASGQLTGRVNVQDDGQWIVWAWRETGPTWIALASGTANTLEEAQRIADERVMDEWAKHYPVLAEPRPPREMGEE